jgi:hypothetical protein
MKLKSFLIAASIASLAVPALANDQTDNLGAVPAPYAHGITEFHFQPTSFIDLVSFTIGSTSTVTFTTTEIPNVVHPSVGPAIVVWSIPQIADGLYQDVGGTVALPVPHYVPSLGAQVGSTQNGWGSETFASLAPGKYVFATYGTAAGSYGGTYLASLTVTAVPEPESYAMLLAGLGLMGFVARRRARG